MVLCEIPKNKFNLATEFSRSGDNTDQNGGGIRFWAPNLGLSPKHD